RGVSWTRGMSQSPDSSIWRLAWAKRASSRSMTGMAGRPTPYTAAHTRSSTPRAIHGRDHHRPVPRIGAGPASPLMVSPSRIRIARDYNRTLAAPVRWAHLLAAVVATVFGGGWMWASASGRRAVALPAILLVLALLVLPMDAAISRWF